MYTVIRIDTREVQSTHRTRATAERMAAKRNAAAVRRNGPGTLAVYAAAEAGGQWWLGPLAEEEEAS